MKIVIDARTMGSKPSGIGMSTFNFIKEFIRHNKHQLILLTDVATSDEMRYVKAHGVEVREYGKIVYRSAAVFKYFAFVKKELKAINPDLFWEPNNLIPVRLSGYHGKIMVTINDIFPISHSEYFSLKYRLYFRIMLAKTIKMADYLEYISKESKDSVEKVFLSAAKKKSHVGYIPFEVANSETTNNDGTKESEHANTLDMKKRFGENGYFLYVGNMEARKGVDLLIKAYKKYVNNGGKKSLVLAGKSRESQIDELIQSAQSVPGFYYLGYVNPGMKQTLMQNSDCFVFPSRAEGFGMGVLEAMQFYKPILVSDLAIFNEIVGDCIQYFPLGKTLEESIEHLADAMEQPFEVKDVASKQYQIVLEKYKPKVLGDSLEKFIES